MARALVQSTNIPSSVVGERTTNFSGPGRTKKTVAMLCNAQSSTAQSSSIMLRKFPRLQGFNAVDALGRTGQTLQSKVAAATSKRRPRGCRFVTKANFEHFTEANSEHFTEANFEHFTDQSILVIMFAQYVEARRLGHNFIDTEQILLSIIGEGTGIAAKVLKSMGINLEDARVEVEKITGSGDVDVDVDVENLEIPCTPRAKRVLELSWEEARQLGHKYIGTEHLLLGLLREDDGVAARVLKNLGADPSNIRAQVIQMAGESDEAPPEDET